MANIRVLLVAQSPVLRFGIRGILESMLPLEAVVEAGGALEASAIAPAADPSIIVIHDALPGITGDVTAKMLRELQPQAKIVLMSDDVGIEHVVAAVQNGADVLLSMAIDPAGFSVAVGEVVRSTGVSHPDPAERPFIAGLAAPEIAVLDGIVRGLAEDEIASRLRVTQEAVKTATLSLLRKLDVVDRAAAVVAAVRRGIVNLSDQLPSSVPTLQPFTASAT